MGKDSSYGFYQDREKMLAKDWELDVDRERAQFDTCSKVITGLGPKVESKTWWFVRDELRVAAYNMRSSMLAINKTLPESKKQRRTRRTRRTGRRWSRSTLL